MYALPRAFIGSPNQGTSVFVSESHPAVVGAGCPARGGSIEPLAAHWETQLVPLDVTQPFREGPELELPRRPDLANAGVDRRGAGSPKSKVGGHVQQSFRQLVHRS